MAQRNDLPVKVIPCRPGLVTKMQPRPPLRQLRGQSRYRGRPRINVANEMDAEDGVIWVCGLGDDGVMAFTDFGIENFVELIKIHKDQKPREER
jgi:hypothetical protein